MEKNQEYLYAFCEFTDDVVRVIRYLGMLNYLVEYPDGETDVAHESTLDFSEWLNTRRCSSKVYNEFVKTLEGATG